ncbi:MAG TPA: helix-turn-helix domain-containing protein [Thermoleophilaceae bacterium]|nr:helix-turn-helix domain-containing protein [Thermoleophilaceae bacterium]
MGAGMQTVIEPAEEPAVGSTSQHRSPCCSLYHHAVELVGKRWTGAILLVLMDGPLRFCEIRELVPDVSDRLLSERLKELEAEDVVARRVYDETPVRVEYSLTPKGQALKPALTALKSWSHTYC